MNRKIKYEVSPFVLTKVNIIPTNVIDQIICKNTLHLVYEIYKIEQAIKENSEQVENVLYRLIPRLEQEDRLRRAVLSLKRDAFNFRKPKCTDEMLLNILEHLNDEDRERVNSWFHSFSLFEQMKNQAKETYESELVSTSQSLAKIMDQSDLLKGILISSKDFTEEFDTANTNLWKPQSGYARTAIAYLTRAVMKTTPFSTITQIDLTCFKTVDNKSSRAAEPTKHFIRLFQPIVEMCFQAIAQSFELGKKISFEVNTAIIYSDNAVKVLWDNKLFYRYIPFKTEAYSLVENNSLLNIVKELGCMTQEEWVSRLQEYGGYETFKNLVSLHLINPVTNYHSGDEHPLLELADALRQASSPKAIKIAKRFELIEKTIECMKCDDFHKRKKYLKRIKRCISLVFSELNIENQEWVDMICPVYEDVRLGNIDASLDQNISEELEKVAEKLNKNTIVKNLYNFICKCFVEAYGEGGICENVLEFLNTLINREDFQDVVRETNSIDEARGHDPNHKEDERVVSSDNIPFPQIAVSYQIIAESDEAIKNGDFLIVVNGIFSGDGRLFNRFIPLFNSDENNMENYLYKWNRMVHKNRTCVQVIYGSDWSNLQLPYNKKDKVLVWPGDTRNNSWNESAYAINQLKIIHDSKSGTLAIVSPKSEEISLIYNGTASIEFSPMTIQLLMTISNPWLTFASYLYDSPPIDTFKYYPRISEGKIVYKRALWQVPINMFPIKANNEGEFEYFSKIQAWRIKNNIPEEVFINLSITANEGSDQLSQFYNNKRKPIYVHFGSIHCVEKLRRIIDNSVTGISITELLPTRKDHCYYSVEQNKHAVEHMSILCFKK